METRYYFNINLMFLSHGRIRLSWKDVREPEKKMCLQQIIGLSVILLIFTTALGGALVPPFYR